MGVTDLSRTKSGLADPHRLMSTPNVYMIYVCFEVCLCVCVCGRGFIFSFMHIDLWRYRMMMIDVLRPLFAHGRLNGASDLQR